MSRVDSNAGVTADEHVWSDASPMQVVGNQVAPMEGDHATMPIIRVDGLCENLPPLRPQELTIIGRCITFQGETVVGKERVLLYYMGLVGMVTKDTVMMLHVYRFTSEDFKKYQERSLRATPKSVRTGTHHEENRMPDSRNAQNYENVLETGADPSDGANENEMDDINFLPELQLSREEREELSNLGDSTERHGRPIGSGSLGPIPFMTFSRRRIHGVVFAEDMHSRFYTIFRDPSRRHFDMQCLRMFVRRYLIHSSRGTNPHDTTLQSFLAWRCNCKCIDAELLIDVAKQELALLVKAEREIVKCLERVAHNRRGILHLYQPPPGLFSDTGILFLTRIPMQTFCLAILELILTLLLIGFSAYSFSMTSSPLVSGYVRKYSVPVFFAGVASIFASAVTAFHSFKMRIPVSLTVRGTLRIVLATISIGIHTMVLILVGGAVSFGSIGDYLGALTGPPWVLCEYYRENNCSGFGELCNGSSSNRLCMWDICPVSTERSCTYLLIAAFTRVFIPIIVLCMILILLFLIDHFMHLRLMQLSRQLLSQL